MDILDILSCCSVNRDLDLDEHGVLGASSFGPTLQSAVFSLNNAYILRYRYALITSFDTSLVFAPIKISSSCENASDGLSRLSLGYRDTSVCRSVRRC